LRTDDQNPLTDSPRRANANDHHNGRPEKFRNSCLRKERKKSIFLGDGSRAEGNEEGGEPGKKTEKLGDRTSTLMTF